jgi:hypothetical protein
MARRDKYANNMAKHLGEEIDAAAPITNSANGQIGAAVGGALGAIMAEKGAGAASDVEIGQFAWLGLGPTHFAITKSSAMGKPTGDPLVKAAYADVAGIELDKGKLGLRCELALKDGRAVIFEAKRQGMNKVSEEVVEDLKNRCTVA